MPIQTICTVTGRDVCVVSVQCDTQKLFSYEQVEHHLTNRSLDPAERLHLFGCQL